MGDPHAGSPLPLTPYTMAKQSKTLRAAYEKIDTEKAYPLKEAVQLMLEHKTVKFDATAELHMNLGIDPKHADQQVRTTLSLPHGTGKTVKVIAFCEDDKIKDAKAAEISPIYRAEYAGFILQPLMPTFNTIVFITVKAKVSET